LAGCPRLYHGLTIGVLLEPFLSGGHVPI
jgi:hypothetical protein